MFIDANMTAASKKSSIYFLSLILLSSLVSGNVSSSSRCQDGTYMHDGKECCKCAIGLRVVEHCTENENYGKCEICEHETYSSEPNGHMTCERCTSCSQINANLEVDEPCTHAKDSKCRCKAGHYCHSSTEICLLCQSCKTCGAEGIKVECTPNNDTICNDKVEGGNHVEPTAGLKVGIIVSVLVALVMAVVLGVCWRRKRKRMTVQHVNGNATNVEMQNLRDVDLQHHLPDIANIIIWTEMKDIAAQSGVSKATIDSCKLNHPGDSREQTYELLMHWVEGESRGAGRKLIEMLNKNGKRAKAEKVKEILYHGAG